MMIPNGLPIGCLAFVMLVALILWWFTGLVWWAILLIAVAVPPLAITVLLIVGCAIWMDGGSH